MFKHRLSRWDLLLGVVLLFQLVTAVLSVWNRNDMDIFLAVARDLHAGRNIYAEHYFQWFSYFYSLAFALLMTPLSWLPVALAKLLWAAVGMVVIGRSYHIVAAWLDLDGLAPDRRRWIQAVAGLVLLQAVRDNLNTGQSTLVLCWCCLETLWQAQRGRAWIAALILAFGIDMKLLPLIVVPYLAYRAQWRVLLQLPLWLALWVAVPMAVLGTDHGLELLRTRWSLIDPSDTRHILDDEEPDFIALGSLLSAYLGDAQVNDHGVDLPRRLSSLSPEAIGRLLLLGRALLALGMLWFLRTLPFRPAPSDRHRAWEVGYLLACVPLLFPHQQNYSMYFMAPAVLYLVRQVEERRGMAPIPRWSFVPLVVLALAANAHLLLGAFGAVYDHYKLLSLTLVFLLVWLGSAPPEGERSAADRRTP